MRGERGPADTLMNRTAPKEALSFAFTDPGLNGFYRTFGTKGLVRIFKSEIIDASINLLWGEGFSRYLLPDLDDDSHQFVLVIHKGAG